MLMFAGCLQNKVAPPGADEGDHLGNILFHEIGLWRSGGNMESSVANIITLVFAPYLCIYRLGYGAEERLASPPVRPFGVL